jgi:hypothetical protein
VWAQQFREAPWHQKMACVALLLLPFQYALTIEFGFPLKLSEIAVAVAIVMALFSGQLRQILRGVDLIFVAVIGVSVLTAGSIAALAVDTSTQLQGVPRNQYVDIAIYMVYGIFVLAFWILLRAGDGGLLRDVLLQSMWVCAAAVLFQAGSRLAQADSVASALGFETTTRGLIIAGIQFGRSGPFLQGQHLGFYAGMMLVFALCNKRWATALISLVCVLYSESTTAFVAVAPALLLAILARPTKKKLISLGAAVVAAAVVVLSVRPLREMFFFQLAKLGVTENTTFDAGLSLDARWAKTQIAWQMMWDHPWGVGPGRFAAYFWDYAPDYPGLPSYMFTTDRRPIVENGPMQIGAELGVVAFVALLALFVWLFLRVWHRDVSALAVLLFVAIGFLTQSSWTFMPVWAGLGYVAAVAIAPKPHAENRNEVKTVS